MIAQRLGGWTFHGLVARNLHSVGYGENALVELEVAPADAELRRMKEEKSIEGNGPKGEALPSNPPSQNKSDAPAESIALKTLILKIAVEVNCASARQPTLAG